MAAVNPTEWMGRLDPASRQELAQFAEQQQALAEMQGKIHELTDKCWKKCVTGGISSKFSRGEASCLENCADRFLDASTYIIKEISAQRNQLH